MENMDRRKKFMQGKRTVSVAVNESTFHDFKVKLAKDGITQADMIKTAIDRYLKGIDNYK